MPDPDEQKSWDTIVIREIICHFLDKLFDKGYFLARYHIHGDNCLDDKGKMKCGLRTDELHATEKSLDDLLDEYFKPPSST